jgi:hypothetical protein
VALAEHKLLLAAESDASAAAIQRLSSVVAESSHAQSLLAMDRDRLAAERDAMAAAMAAAKAAAATAAGVAEAQSQAEVAALKELYDARTQAQGRVRDEVS